jgi:hypothetical protein
VQSVELGAPIDHHHVAGVDLDVSRRRVGACAVGSGGHDRVERWPARSARHHVLLQRDRHLPLSSSHQPTAQQTLEGRVGERGGGFDRGELVGILTSRSDSTSRLVATSSTRSGSCSRSVAC